jgi:tetratricopeptide (TPR) repeat protein
MFDRDGGLDRQDLDVKDRADRALRAGKAAEALPLYSSLLRKVDVMGAGLYEGWLEGAAACYQSLGRTREAGYVLVALRRFAEAERCFDPQKQPHEWALCAANLGRPREASRTLAQAGHTALAALALESAGDWSAARQAWEAVLAEERLRTCPYEAALVHFNLGQTLRRLATWRPPAARWRSPSGCSRSWPTASRPRATPTAPSSATACCSASARTPARSRTWPRAT